MEDEREELEADIQKLHQTLEEDRNQWQYDDLVDSDDDSDDEEEDVLRIDLDKHGSATASVASISARSAGGRTTPSGQSTGSHRTAETQSVATEQEDDLELFREVGVVQGMLDSSSTLPASLESCLVINTAYQDIVSQHINRIELELAENKEAQRRIEEEAKESSLMQQTKKRFPYSASLPYFKLKYGSTPAQNEDTQMKRLTEEPDLDQRPEAPWYQRHKRLLTQAVIEDALEKLLQPLLSRRELDEEKLKKVAEESDAWNSIHERIVQIDKEIEEKKMTPSDQLLRTVDPDRVDWMKIANMHFAGKRDWKACRRAWLHSVDPKLNQEPIQSEEEMKLIQLIRETNCTNWVYIAQQLGTGRTAFQCLQYYQQNLNSEMLNRPWTKDEDKQLIRVVEKCQQYHFNWSKVAQYMEGRSGMQCYKRFSKLDPNINKGYWTESEDAQLMAAVQLLGTHNWGRVHELVPGRTREQCRERYFNSLDPSISGEQWTYEEDKQLLQLVQQYGPGSWVKMCKDLPGRTDNQILQRYRRLEDWKRKADWFKQQSLRDRDLLQGNNLPAEQKRKAQEKNWEQFMTKFGVYPDDYRKQQIDIDNGDIEVPRPPFMIGLAMKSGSKVWERRFKLHRLIEGHINKLKEKFNFIDPSITGVYELQDAISQLSKECIAKRDHLMNMRKDRLGQLIHGLPSSLNVKDLLAVSRGGQVRERQVRGPLAKKRVTQTVKKTMAPRLHQSKRLDAELRKVVRANLKERSQKKGRPRRFFWDISGDQKLADDEVEDLKATAFGLYMKSLGVNYLQLLTEGRRAFPKLFHRIQQEQLQSAEDKGDDQPGPSGEGQPLRRSRRAQKRKQEAAEEPVNTDPFSLSGKPSDSAGFAQWQRQRDYQLLEWIARIEGTSLDVQHSGEVSVDQGVSAASSIELGTAETTVTTSVASSDKESESNTSTIGQGMRLVHASIQQAMDEREAMRLGEIAAGNSADISGHCAEGDAVRDSEHCQVLSSGGVGASSSAAETGQGSQNILQSNSSQLSHNVPSFHPPVPWGATSSTSYPGQQSAGSRLPQPTPGSSSDNHSDNHGQQSSSQHQLPNLPPTITSIQSFKTLLLRRLGLIKKAGSYYHLPYYLQKKDQQLASLIKAGIKMPELNRGTIDLSRMMNRVSQETNFTQRKKWTRRTAQCSLHPEVMEDSSDVDLSVLETLKQTQDYKLLQSRFEAVFTWPALLSAVYPPFQRKDYLTKAGGKSHRIRVTDPDAPQFELVRKKPAMLKSKGFYKYANKTMEEKQNIVKKRREKRILRQVQRLMADENDPKPYVTLQPDSDDDMSNGPAVTNPQDEQSSATTSSSAVPHPCPSDTTESAGTSGLNPVPKKPRRKYKKRFSGRDGPVRHSARAIERKTYSDGVYKQRKQGPRKPRQARVEQPVQQGPPKTMVRPPRLPKSVRIAMIDAMVDMKNEREQVNWGLGRWNPGGYVSDDSADNMEEEMLEGSQWLTQLGREQQDSMALLERESIVETYVKDSPKSSQKYANSVVCQGGSSQVDTNQSVSRVLVDISGSDSAPHRHAASSSVPAPNTTSAQTTFSTASTRNHVAQQPVTDSVSLDLDGDDDNEPTVASLLAAKRRKMQS